MSSFQVLKITLGIFTILALFFLYDFLDFSNRYKKFQLISKKVNGEIVRKGIWGAKSKLPYIKFQFVWKGRKYSGKNYVDNELYKKYVVGDKVVILFDSKNPKKNQLNESRGIYRMDKFLPLTLAIIFGFISVTMFFIIFLGTKKEWSIITF